MQGDMRAAFEAWVRQSAAELCPLTDTEIAWEAWQESAKRFETAAGWSMQNGTCHLYRTADGLREHILEQQKDPEGGLHVHWIEGVVLHD